MDAATAVGYFKFDLISRVSVNRMSAFQSNHPLQEWSESAAFWEKHAATIHQIFAPVTRALIESAAIAAGQNVLDVAGGAGEPSLTIADVIGPSGFVTCTDAVENMVRAAENEARRRNITNVRFHQCAADSVPFPDNSFDAVVSRLGVMFFPDPLLALHEMLRVTKPGGSLALVVWDQSEVNPFLHLISTVVSRHVEPAPADADAPGAFRFAEHGKLAAVLSAANATNVHERGLQFQIEAPITFAQFWELRSETSATLRDKMSALSSAQMHSVITEAEEATRDFFVTGKMSFPAAMIIVSGKKRSLCS